MNYHENARFFYGINKLIVNLSLIVSIDTYICVFMLGGYCRNSCSGDYEYDGRELRDGKCGHVACNCTLTIGNSSVSIRADGANMATISLESHCGEGGYTQEATVSSNQSWCSPRITSVGSSKRIMISCDANTSTSSRSATVTVRNECGASRTITVTQEGQPECTLTALPITMTFVSRPAVGSEKSVTVSSSTGQFDASVSDSWIKISNETSSGFDVLCASNLGNSRSGTITVTNSCGLSRNITVNQQEGGSVIQTGSIYCTLQLVAANCCDGNRAISFSGSYSIDGKPNKTINQQPIGDRFLLESGVSVGSHSVKVIVTAVQCDGTTLGESFNLVEGNDTVEVTGPTTIGNEATAYFNLRTTCS